MEEIESVDEKIKRLAWGNSRAEELLEELRVLFGDGILDQFERLGILGWGIMLFLHECNGDRNLVKAELDRRCAAKPKLDNR